jgi:hypothetical protein
MLGRKYTPLIVYILYVLFVIYSLLGGPLKYKYIDTFSVLTYVSLVTMLFSIGYIFGAAGKINSPGLVSFQMRASMESRQIRFINRFVLGLGLIVVIFSWYGFFDSGKNLGFSNLGENYIGSYEGYVRGQAKIDVYYILGIFSHSIIALCLAFGTYYFVSYSRSLKIIFLFITLSYLFIQVLGSGKQKYLGDVVIAFGVYLLFFRARLERLKAKHVLFLFPLLVVILVFIVFLFLEILRQRYGAANIGVININEKVHPLIYWDLDSYVFKLLGDEYGFSYGIFLGYFSNGMYGLSLCLNLPFTWTYFVGNSYSLTRVAEIVLNQDKVIQQDTYPYKAGVVYGWDESKWHSLYAWMASDVTFSGVVFFAGLFGFFYAKTWKSALSVRDPFSGPLFFFLTLGLVFSLANNQLLHSMPGIISFLSLLVLKLVWVLARRSKEK